MIINTRQLLTTVFLVKQNTGFLPINVIRFLLPQAWFLYILISYQLLNKPLRFAQAFVFKTFHIVSPVLTSLSHENVIETSMT